MTALLAPNRTPTGSAPPRRTGTTAAAVPNVYADEFTTSSICSMRLRCTNRRRHRGASVTPLTVPGRLKYAILNPVASFNTHRSILAARAVRAG